MIEPLESRIAPASTFGYFDIDGDSVTITSSKGAGTDLRDVLTLTTGVPMSRVEIAKIDLASDATTFAGTSITMTVKRGPNGDGFAHIGAIIATGMDLGVISIKGDLGQIDVGNPATLTKAFTSLTVKSIGTFGVGTQGGMGDLTSAIAGATGPIVIKGDLAFATLQGTDGSFPSISIAGSMVNSSITSTGGIGALAVKYGAVSSSVSATDAISKITFGGSFRFGSIVAGSLGAVKIGGDFEAADADGAGFLRAITGNIGTVTIAGDFRGGITSSGGGTIFGAILAAGNIGAVSVAGDFVGEADANSAGRSGVIDANGRIGKIAIRGSLISPSSAPGVLLHANDDIGSISIGGNVRGGEGPDFVLITAGGQANPTPGKDLAMGSITIGGSVFGLHIGAGVLEGTNSPFVAQGNGDAQIGTVRVGGDFLNSNIVAGVLTGAFSVATGDDSVYTMGTALTNSLIRKIVIGGAVEGNNISANVHFGFTAQKIGSLTVGGLVVPLQVNALDRFDLGRTPTKFSIREV